MSTGQIAEIGHIQGRPRFRIDPSNEQHDPSHTFLAIITGVGAVYALCPSNVPGTRYPPVHPLNRLPSSLVRHTLSYLLPNLSRNEYMYLGRACWNLGDMDHVMSESVYRGSISHLLWFYRPDNIFEKKAFSGSIQTIRSQIEETCPLTLSERAILLLTVDTDTYSVAERRRDWYSDTKGNIEYLKRWFLERVSREGFIVSHLHKIQLVTGPFSQDEWEEVFVECYLNIPPMVFTLAHAQGFQMTQSVITILLGAADESLCQILIDMAIATGRYVTEIGNALSDVRDRYESRTLGHLLEIYGNIDAAVESIQPYNIIYDAIRDHPQFAERALKSERWSKYHMHVTEELFCLYRDTGKDYDMIRLVSQWIPVVNEYLIQNFSDNTNTHMHWPTFEAMRRVIGTDIGQPIWSQLALMPLDVQDHYHGVNEILIDHFYDTSVMQFTCDQIIWLLKLNPHNLMFMRYCIENFIDQYPDLIRYYTQPIRFDSDEYTLTYMRCLQKGYQHPIDMHDRSIRLYLKSFIQRQNALGVEFVIRTGRVHSSWIARTNMNICSWFLRCIYGRGISILKKN